MIKSSAFIIITTIMLIIIITFIVCTKRKYNYNPFQEQSIPFDM